MKQLLLIGILVLLNVSCSDSTPKYEGVNEVEEIKKLESPVEKSNVPELKNTLEVQFYEFWDEFRIAVEKGKTEDILNMTNYPFETRGEMDSDPLIMFSKKDFIKLLPELMNQSAGIDLEGTSEAGVVIKTKKVAFEEIERESVRVGNLVFDKMKTGWKFTFAYVNSPTYELIGIKSNR